MADVPAQGSQATLAMDAALPFDASSEPFEFVSSTLKMQQSHVRSEGIRGTRQRRSERVRISQEAVSGNIVMNPSVTELDLLWTRILGGTVATGVTDVAETLPEFWILRDDVSKVHTFNSCRVARATFSGTQGQPIQLTLDIEGEDETIGNAGTAPALTLDTDNFFIFSDLTLTLQSTARKFRQFTLVIDNMLDVNRFNNSLTRTEIATQDMEVTLSVEAPYTVDNTDLEDQAIAGAAGILVVTDAVTTYTFDFANVKSESEGPDNPGRSEIFLPLNNMTCYATAANSAVKVTKT